jgi:hypothetical protein
MNLLIPYSLFLQHLHSRFYYYWMLGKIPSRGFKHLACNDYLPFPEDLYYFNVSGGREDPLLAFALAIFQGRAKGMAFSGIDGEIRARSDDYECTLA